MKNFASTSLAQIATANHKAVSIFEKYELDFCCRGKQSLQQACEEKSLPLDEIVTELNSLDDSRLLVNYNDISLTQLIERIVLNHHNYVRREIPVISALLHKVTSKHGERHPELQQILDAFMLIKAEMLDHMQKEELVLFPRIKKLDAEGPAALPGKTYISMPISVLETEHDHAGRLLEKIRQLTNNYTPPAGACTSYMVCYAALGAFEQDMHQHVHLENNILFPKALQMFDAA